MIVESPAKAKTINKYLGEGYLVKASMGHIKDLPKSKMGVDIENNFQPTFQVIPGREKIVSELKELAKKAAQVILATDPDREGEAIGWHLTQVLEKSNGEIYRALLHEITKEAVREAFNNLGKIDQNKVGAQLARRILDRLVGYLISPLLWKKIGKGLSAGRVQSVALRLICAREKEIRDFIPEEYWTITAFLSALNPPPFKANLVKIDNRKVKIKNEKEAQKIVVELEKSPFILDEIEVKEKKKYSSPPYITSTLQQEAFRIHHYSVKKTMLIAQRLYEGLEVGEEGLVGLITYMRTDSVRVSDEAIHQTRDYIKSSFGSKYLPTAPRIFKNKRKAQDAHEAIRPTSVARTPEMVKPFLKKEEYTLYRLIWNRFVASQMSPAEIEETTFDIKAGQYLFQAKGEIIRFPGFTILYKEKKEEESVLPRAEKGERLKLKKIEPKQNFTQPPPRYTEGSLVKELEAKGIGRPSTYSTIISTLQNRVYVIKEKGRFIPTELGIFVTDFLIQHFPDIIQTQFTARMEEELDKISEGEEKWVKTIKEFYTHLDRDLKKAYQEGENVKSKGIPVEEKCPECGANLVIKEGKFGRFLACTSFPECKFTQSLTSRTEKILEEKCPECGSSLVLRKGKYGQFIACSNYPRCKYTKKESQDTGIPCPKGCGGNIVERKSKKGRIFYGCSKYPECDFATWDKPILQVCPECGSYFLLEKKSLKGEKSVYCYNEDCNYKKEL
ncbi:MAG: type I DNA topoisomerase [Candidatus Aminicenantia bacterium]